MAYYSQNYAGSALIIVQPLSGEHGEVWKEAKNKDINVGSTSFQSSFTVSACQLWNSLPNQVITLSSRSFKSALLFSLIYFYILFLTYILRSFTCLHV